VKTFLPLCVIVSIISSFAAPQSAYSQTEDLAATTVQEIPTPIAPTNRIELFNGKSFEGFTFVSRSSTNAPEETWKVTNGVIHCTGQPVGFIRTKKTFRDYKLTLEWRFVKIAPRLDNTGVLLHMQLPDKVWPACVQIQGKHENMGDLFLMAGAESKEHRGKDANTALPKSESNEKPVGEWNTVEAICAGNSVKAYVNGKLLNETTECSVTSGFIGIQCEGAELEIQKMVLEPAK
jgi:hypothetical protein